MSEQVKEFGRSKTVTLKLNSKEYEIYLGWEKGTRSENLRTSIYGNTNSNTSGIYFSVDQIISLWTYFKESAAAIGDPNRKDMAISLLRDDILIGIMKTLKEVAVHG